MTRMGSARFEGDSWDLASSVGVDADDAPFGDVVYLSAELER